MRLYSYLRFLWMASTAYKLAGANGSHYCGLAHPNGPVKLAIFVATGREAWRVVHRAIDDNSLVARRD